MIYCTHPCKCICRNKNMQQPTSNHGHPVRVSLFRFITPEGFPPGRCSKRRLDGLQAPKRLGAWRLRSRGYDGTRCGGATVGEVERRDGHPVNWFGSTGGGKKKSILWIQLQLFNICQNNTGN